MPLGRRFLPCLLLAAAPLAAQDLLGPFQIESYEILTQNVGGGNVTSYGGGVKVLRCRHPYDAMVGVRIRKGSVVDYMQPLCAPLHQDRRSGRLFWVGKEVYGDGSNWAGNTQGGSPRRAICKQDQAIEGFLAVYTLDNVFLDDIRFECAQITGLAKGQRMVDITGRTEPVNWVRTSAATATYAGWISENSTINGQLSGGLPQGVADSVYPRQDPIRGTFFPARSQCTDSAATGLAVGVDRWTGGLMQNQVVKAFQMVCAEGYTDLVNTVPE